MFKLIIMKKILGTILGNKSGLLSTIAENTGKISFKRSAAVIILVAIVKPDVEINGLTAYNTALAIGCLIAVALPKIFTKE